MTATNIYALMTGDWQLDINGLSGVVTGIDDVAQCLRIILLTQKGEDPLRPLFGCGIHQYIDKPLTQIGPAIIREVSEALALWETRIRVTAITPTYSESGLTIEIAAIYLRTGQRERFSIPISSGSTSGRAFSAGFSDGFS